MPNDQKYLLAAESGGTKTLWYLLDRHGRILGKAKSQGMASVQEGMLPLKDIAGGAIAELFGVIPDAPGSMRNCYLSLGGPNTDEAAGVLRSLLPGADVVVDREANGNLLIECSKIYHYDVAVLVGTGTTAVGELNGQRYFAGGWGPDFDDLGSGYWLGLNALKAVLLAAEGRAETTALTEDFAPLIGDTNFSMFASRMALKQRLYTMSRHEIAAYAEAVVRRDETDVVARRLVSQSAENIARMAFSIIRRWPKPDRSIVVLGLGGMLASNHCLVELCRQCLIVLCEYAEFKVDPSFTLGLGACIMALKHGNVANLDNAINTVCGRITQAGSHAGIA